MFLTETGAHRLARSSWHPPGFPLPGAETAVCTAMLGLYMGAEDPNLCAYASTEALHTPSHLSIQSGGVHFSINMKFDSLPWTGIK